MRRAVIESNNRPQFSWETVGIINISDGNMICTGLYFDDELEESPLTIPMTPGRYEVWVKYLHEPINDAKSATFIAGVRLFHYDTLFGWAESEEEKTLSHKLSDVRKLSGFFLLISTE